MTSYQASAIAAVVGALQYSDETDRRVVLRAVERAFGEAPPFGEDSEAMAAGTPLHAVDPITVHVHVNGNRISAEALVEAFNVAYRRATASRAAGRAM